MIDSVELSILTIFASVIGSASVALWRINHMSKELEDEMKAIRAVGSKLDGLRNDFTRINSEYDKDIHFTKNEIVTLKNEMVKKEHLEECVKRHECVAQMGKKADKDELELKLQLIRKDIEHMNLGIDEVKKDLKSILEFLSKGGNNDSPRHN